MQFQFGAGRRSARLEARTKITGRPAVGAADVLQAELRFTIDKKERKEFERQITSLITRIEMIRKSSNPFNSLNHYPSSETRFLTCSLSPLKLSLFLFANCSLC